MRRPKLSLRRVPKPCRLGDVDLQTALLDALPAHIAVLGPNGVIVAVNEAWRRFADDNGLRDPAYGVGRNYLDACGLAPGAGAAQTWAVAAGLRAVLSGERPSYSVEYPCDAPTEPRWFLLIATPLRSAPAPTGPPNAEAAEVRAPAGVIVMHINVSARARAEQASQRSAELLQAVADGTPDIVYVKDTQGRYLLCNQALARFAGRPVEQILGGDDLSLFGATEAAALQADDRSLFDTAAVQATEQWLTGDGGPRLFHATRAPYRDARGRVAGVIGIARDITQERQAQQELQDSRAMLDMAGRSAKLGGWTFDVLAQRLRWSDRVASLHDEPTGHSPTLEQGLAGFLPAHRAAVRDAVARCAEFGTPYDLEAEKVSATGRRFWVRTIGEAVRNEEGRIVRVQGALQDITERKLAALQTQQLAQRLGNTLESITDAFFSVDRDWRFTYINHQAERLWGRERQPMLGRVLWELYPEALDTVFERNYRRAMGGETGLRFEAPYAPLQMWFGIDCHPLEDGLSVYFRDVTQTRAARQQLQLLEASVAQLNDMVLITEVAAAPAGGQRIVFVNQAFERMTGYARADVIGRSPSLLHGAATDRAELARVRAATDRCEPVHAELLMVTRAGRPHWIELDITPVATAGDGCTHLVSVGRDIGERRRSEEALRELTAGLEERVRLRTRDLERARELADQANRAKSSFLATMSHEIRTPMNGVIGMIDVLEESRLRPDQRDMVRTVRESACTLLAIVDDVLDFSKIEAGQFTIDHGPMDVAAVVEGVGQALRPLAKAQGVQLRVHADPRLPPYLLGDGARLRQVLMNLVGNAIKFSSGLAHPGAVSLRARRIPGPGPGRDRDRDRDRAENAGHSATATADQLTLEVRDNGVGMDAGTVARLFSPFTQADASTTRRFGGTGLGLSISHRLVAMMQGDITVGSRLGQGATFTVRLPMALATAPAVVRAAGVAAPRGDGEPGVSPPAAAREGAGRPRAAASVGTHLLILVAEDNEINQQVLKKQLALLGYRAQMVGNGAEALAQWRLGGHALLLTDLHMPEMDGYTLAAAVRAEEAGGRRMPILALTANALRDEALRCREAGMDGYLTKPVRLAQLKTAIDAWLRPPPPPPPSLPTPSTPLPADLSILAELVGHDPQVVDEVLHAFRASVGRSASDLVAAQAAGTGQAVADLAHKLKSAARAVGALALGQICADIEEAATATTTATATATPAGARLDALMTAFDHELHALYGFLDERQPGHA